MGTLKIGSVSLGDTIYCFDDERFVLAPDESVAKEIMEQLRIHWSKVECIGEVTSTCKATHRLGTTISVVKSGVLYVLDTVLVFGSPRGLDTTVPNKIVYKR